MLDDLKLIHEKDPQDALGVCEKQWQYLSREFDANFTPSSTIQNVVLAGMGGSALPGVIMASWPQVRVPFEIVRGYSLPPYVHENTLFISSSYSGNTEETLEALMHAEERGAQIVIIAAGGKLADIAKEKNYPLYAIPSGIQPRMATFYFLNAFVKILSPLGLTVSDGSELAEASEWLRAELAKLAPTIPTAQNRAKQIAQELMGKTVIMYGGPLLFPAANKWKICMNENAKNTAWCNQYPEFNHNEFIGWSSHPIEKPFAVVEIRSDLEHPRILKRFEVSERLLSGNRPAPIVVKPEGDTLLKQLLWSIAMGDFVSVYLALLNGVNPTPVDLVEKLKVELNA
ncbi:MAG TPA: bifunctional phosphoglucose/phosphomannose isomerase [Candidatus Saccharimonadales bacterium]|nr:bifunctional phosphoglucose/phosphomannose isomerase [Candidatus Saccharimonadales bacterium]